MVKVPYINGHDLVRLDKAIRTLQIRFLGKRRRRVVDNVRRLHSHQRTSAQPPIHNSIDTSDLSVGSRRGENGENAENAAKWNGNGGDMSNANDSTYDDVSINESSIASNDVAAEQHSEIVARKKNNRRSLMHKLGGLFSSDKVTTPLWFWF